MSLPPPPLPSPLLHLPPGNPWEKRRTALALLSTLWLPRRAAKGWTRTAPWCESVGPGLPARGTPWWHWWTRESRWTRADTGLAQDFIALQASSLPKEKASFAQPRPLVSPRRGCCGHQAEPGSPAGGLWVAPPSEAPCLFLLLCLIHGQPPRWCLKHTSWEGREPVCRSEEVPLPLSPKGNLPSPPGSPPASSLTAPFATEAMSAATRRPRSKVLPPIFPPPRCCLSLQGLPSPSHLHHTQGPWLLTPRHGGLCAPPVESGLSQEARSHPRVGSDRPRQNDALNPRPGAPEGRGPLRLSADSLPHLTLRGADASLWARPHLPPGQRPPPC